MHLAVVGSALLLALGACGDDGGSLLGAAVINAPGDEASPSADRAGQGATQASAETGGTTAATEAPETESPAADADSADGGFPWAWVVVGVVAVALIAAVAAALNTRRNRAVEKWRMRVSRLAQEGLIVIDVATPEAPRTQPSPFSLETLAHLEHRLDTVVRHADELANRAPDVRSSELVGGVSQSARSFASAVAAERASRQSSDATSPESIVYSTQRLIERRHELDLNLRELSWMLQEPS